ncbi:MAG: ANTAR domain-containing protein, partial [Oscillospiraceae bacterium]|nr:ANTAR domain-containing protein [Oscillospiraceae bacterium]
QTTVEEKIDEIRLVNRAKWLLIAHEGLTEPEAHRLISKTAMDRHRTKREIAQEILQKYE